MPTRPLRGHAPRTLSEHFDRLDHAPIEFGEHRTPIETVDLHISWEPELMPIREFHVLLPALATKPRAADLADPFLALHKLALCLVTRVEAEFQTAEKHFHMLDDHR